MTDDEEDKIFTTLEAGRSCMPWGPACPDSNAAKFIMIKSCCGMEIPLCGECKQKAMTEAVRLNASDHDVVCFICKNLEDVITATWKAL